jgi:hypothetical protein
LRAKGECRYTSAFSRHEAPEVCVSLSPRQEGAGNAGCALHPRSRVQTCTRTRTRAYRAAEAIRHSLRNGSTAYFALTPGYRAFLPPSSAKNWLIAPGRADLPSADLTPTSEASGPHDFAVRFGAARPARPRDRSRSLSRPAIPSRARCLSVHRIPSQRSVTMANAPSSGTGCVIRRSDLPDGESEILPVGLICRRCGFHGESTGLRQNPSPSLPATDAKRLRKGALLSAAARLRAKVDATKQSISQRKESMDCFAEPVIGRAFERPVDSQ